jgi:hypothetical protein
MKFFVEKLVSFTMGVEEARILHKLFVEEARLTRDDGRERLFYAMAESLEKAIEDTGNEGGA